MAKLKAWKGIGPHYPNQDCADCFDQLLMALAETSEGKAHFPWKSAWSVPWPEWACRLREQIYEAANWNKAAKDRHYTHMLFQSSEHTLDGVVIWHTDEINAWYAAAGKALGAL